MYKEIELIFFRVVVDAALKVLDYYNSTPPALLPLLPPLLLLLPPSSFPPLTSPS